MDVDFLVSPWCEDGIPHKACKKLGIPIIYVKGNTVQACMKTTTPDGDIVALDYIEAAGIIMSMNAGILPSSVVQ